MNEMTGPTRSCQVGTENKSGSCELPRVFLITTEHTGTLAEKIKAQLRVPSIEVVSSFDFRSVDRNRVLEHVERKSFHKHHGYMPSNGAVGCALAHRHCYSRIMEEDLSHALIFEDDVVPESLNRDVISELSHLSDFDVITLGSAYAMVKRSPVGHFGAHTLHKWSHYCFGAHAYLVSNAGAKKLLQAQEPRIRRYADWPLNPGDLDLYVLLPAMAELSGRASGIVTESKSEVKLSIFDSVRLSIRARVWRLIGIFRSAVLGDMRI